MRTLFSKLRFSIVYFIYGFEIHRPNVNSVLQSSLNWNKTISVINVRYYAPIVHSTLSSATQPLYPICCQHIPYQPRRAELGFVNENMSCPVLSCLVLSCPVLSPTSEEDLHINKRDQFSFETADTVKRVCYEYYTKPLLFNSLIQRYRWLK